jgi:hypothetical protein
MNSVKGSVRGYIMRAVHCLLSTIYNYCSSMVGMRFVAIVSTGRIRALNFYQSILVLFV